MYKDKHTFAVYLENLSDLVTGLRVGQGIEISDRPLHQRLTRVLKLRMNDQVVLFDKKIKIKLELNAQTFEHGKKVCGKILQIKQGEPLKPEIIVVPCLLKRTFFESVVYIAAQMGASAIQPILSEKIHKPSPTSRRCKAAMAVTRLRPTCKNWWSEKETHRLEKIMISACEQSKNFCFPRFEQPALLETFLKDLDSDSKKVFFNENGQPLFNLLKDLNKNKPKNIVLFFGPEGGLTEKELNLIKSHGFKSVCLTPTILRSVEAVTLGLGVVRSCSQA